MNRPFSIFLSCVLAGVSGHAHAQVESWITPQYITPKTLSQRQLAAPKVEWIVDKHAEKYCRHVEAKDGFFESENGCAYWLTAKNMCTLVTTRQSSHALLGKLFMSCLEGGLQ